MKRSDFLDKVTPLFLKAGYSSLRMDDIADELSMSKKTIYKIFPTKEKLVLAVNDHLFVFLQKMLKKYEPESENVIELYYKMKTAVEDEVADVEQQRQFIKQISKFSPNLLQTTLDFTRNTLYRLAQITTQKAEEEGVLLTMYDHDAINQIFSNNYVTIKLNTEYESLEEFRKIEKQWFYMHLRGVLNQKGIQMLEEYVAKHPEVLY